MSGHLLPDMDLDSLLGVPNRQNSNGNDLLDFSNSLSKDLFDVADFNGKDMPNFDSLVDEVLSSESFSDTSGSASPNSSSVDNDSQNNSSSHNSVSQGSTSQNSNSQNSQYSNSQNSSSSPQNYNYVSHDRTTTQNTIKNTDQSSNSYEKPVYSNFTASPPHNSSTNSSNNQSPQYNYSDRSRYSSNGYSQNQQQQIQYVQASHVPNSHIQTHTSHVQTSHVQTSHVQNSHIQNSHIQQSNVQTSPIYYQGNSVTSNLNHQQSPQPCQIIRQTITNIPKIIQATPVTPSSNIILLDSAQTIKARPGQTLQIMNTDGTFEKITIPMSNYSSIPVTNVQNQHTTVVQIPDTANNKHKRARYSENDINPSYKIINRSDIINLDDSQFLPVKHETSQQQQKTQPIVLRNKFTHASIESLHSDELDHSDEESLLPAGKYDMDCMSVDSVPLKINYGGRTADKKLSKDEMAALENEGLNVDDYLDTKNWTKSQERIIKRIRRKIRNKKSAHESRRRKKEFVEGLQEEFQSVKDENASLRKRVVQLEGQNSQLKSHVAKLKAFISAASQRTAQATTCVMLLVISLAFFLAPNYGPLSLFKNKTDDTSVGITGQQERSSEGPVFVSRRILQLFDDDGNLLDEPIINEPDFGNTTDDEEEKMVDDNELAMVKLENGGNSGKVNKNKMKTNLYKFNGGGVNSDIAGHGNRVMSRNLSSVLRRRQLISNVPVKKEFNLESSKNFVKPVISM